MYYVLTRHFREQRKKLILFPSSPPKNPKSPSPQKKIQQSKPRPNRKRKKKKSSREIDWWDFIHFIDDVSWVIGTRLPIIDRPWWRSVINQVDFHWTFYLIGTQNGILDNLPSSHSLPRLFSLNRKSCEYRVPTGSFHVHGFLSFAVCAMIPAAQMQRNQAAIC